MKNMLGDSYKSEKTVSLNLIRLTCASKSISIITKITRADIRSVGVVAGSVGIAWRAFAFVYI